MTWVGEISVVTADQGPKGGETVPFTDKAPEPATMARGGSLKLYPK